MKVAAMIALMLITMSLPAPLLGLASHATIKQVQTYTHTFYAETVLDAHKCSATAIGPHALLTATHCELGVDVVAVDDPETAIKILRIVRDGSDHTIYYLDTTFPVYAPINTTLPEAGDDVFMIGGPAAFTAVFRRGYVAKVETTGFFERQTIVLYDMNGFHGDSGAGIFNDSGELIGVLSAGITLVNGKAPAPDDMTAKFMTGLALQFTEGQLEDARK